MSDTAILVWGNQLSIKYNSAIQGQLKSVPVILIEAKNVCRKYKYHKQKLAFVLTAMREYADELRASGRTVHYIKLENTDDSWFESLAVICTKYKLKHLVAMRQNDRTPQERLESWCKQHDITLAITPNRLFLTSTALFNEWAEGQKRLQMEQFYRWQRRRLSILMTGDKPTGGRWNFDSENRRPLPKNHDLPALQMPARSKHSVAVHRAIAEHFANHPGDLETQWLPTTRPQAYTWLQQFIEQRFGNFGMYEDAMRRGETFLYHSSLSALLNIGLLHASEVVDAALRAGSEIPLATKEGFVRQIIGWREFMFGLYHYRPHDWISDNFLEHHKKLPDWWWTLDAAKAPEPPLQDVVARLKTYGYNHHIERLMVLGNYMLLAGYQPRQVYDWFMTMYVDSYEWVMVPNVIGMSQYADGGFDKDGFATKPYISGSNYLQKMGSWWPSAAAAKQSDWTDMYWQFLHRNQAKLSKNFRLQRLFTQANKHHDR